MFLNRMYYTGHQECNTDGCKHYHIGSTENDNFVVVIPLDLTTSVPSSWLKDHCEIRSHLIDANSRLVDDDRNGNTKLEFFYELIGIRDKMVERSDRPWGSNFTCRLNTCGIGGDDKLNCTLEGLYWDSDLKRPYSKLKTTRCVPASRAKRTELLWPYFTNKYKLSFE